MSHIPDEFADRLIGCESPTPAYRAQYKKEVREMLEKRLGKFQRALYGVFAVFCLAMAVVFAVIAVALPAELPIWGTIWFAVGSLVWAAFAALMGPIAVRGQFKPKLHGPAMAGAAWGACVLFATMAMLAAPTFPDPMVGIRMVLFTLVFLVMAAVFLLAARTEQAELRTKEKLLEIEYRIAELAENLQQSGGK